MLVTFVGTGCSSMAVRPAPQPAEMVVPSGARADLTDGQDTIKAKMYRQYRQWQGTAYAYGGLSKHGIDCSGFVYLTYLEQLGIELPRSTELQAQVGQEVKRDDLRAGDLVFFNTGFRGRHVGIYLEQGRFLHVSTKRGVVISSLVDDYWKERYWQSRRVGL
jgi:cell wall-associated NlpC family hydrolase